VIGTETDSLDEKTVVDLIINGRMPKNPIVVDCHNIEFMNPTNEWVGFRVSYNIEGFVISNLFELEIIQTKALNNPDETNIIIKRVNNINPIVAGNLLKYWPTTNIPLIHSQNPFNMYHLFNYDNLDVIGDIRVERHLGSPITVDLCVANTFSPWNYNDYSFEALVAKDIIGSPQPFTINEDPLSDRDRITFTNPITNTLNIYLPNYSSNKGEDTKISIATLEGRVILNRQFHVSEGSISLPVDNFPQGFYLVHIKNKFETKVLKIFKY
jgi:hypothetical protein